MFEDACLEAMYEERYESDYDESFVDHIERDHDEPYEPEYADGVDDDNYEVTGCENDDWYDEQYEVEQEYI